MEECRDSAGRDMSLSDSSGLNVIDHVDNKTDSNKTVSKTSSTHGAAENTILDNSISKTNLSDNNCNLQSELLSNGSDSKSSSVQEVQFAETVISNEKLESKLSSVGDENDLNIPGSVNNMKCRREQDANSENSAGVKELQSDLVSNTCKVLEIDSEQARTKPGATNLEGCSSGNIHNVSDTITLGNGIVKQSVNEEKRDGSVTKHISYNKEVEAMVTEDHVEDSEKAIEGSVSEKTIPDNNSNNISTFNKDTEKCRDEEVINETKETNGNLNSSTDRSEPMVTDDSLEKGEVVIETQSDAENNTDMINGMEGIRNASVVEAMNKDQSWKADKVYKKDLRSLQLLCDYGSDSDGDDNPEKMNEDADHSNKTIASSVPAVNPCPAVNQEYREPEVVAVSDSEESDSSDETSSTSSATSSSSSDETEEESAEDECVVVEEKKKKEIPKTKGELGLEDLPPIEDLHITVPESECVEIGKVLSIVDSLVVVQSMKGCPALDLESVLFLDYGHNVLGEVFDVFGKVGEACYCVRFNSKDHAIQKGVVVGMPVYYAPKTEYSKYVFLADLTKMKGSDASWAHNNEPPSRFLDYSDDEEERRARKGSKPPIRNVEREETQPQAKKLYRRGPNRGGGNAPTSPRSNPFWATPFNRYVRDGPSSPPRSPPPSPGPKPLIRPSSFRNSGPSPPHERDNDRSFGGPLHPARPGFQPPMQCPPYRNAGPPQNHFHDNSPLGGPAHRYQPHSSFMHTPPQSHFHNAAAGAPPVCGTSSQMFPPQFGRQDFKFDMNIPPPQPTYSHNQMESSSMNMNDGGYRQGPQPNIMRPTSIPNPGLFAVEPSNGFKIEAPPSFTPNQPPLMRQDFHGSYGGGPPSPFGGQQPVFMNPNVPPPLSATRQSPPSRHPHTGW